MKLYIMIRNDNFIVSVIRLQYADRNYRKGLARTLSQYPPNKVLKC